MRALVLATGVVAAGCLSSPSGLPPFDAGDNDAPIADAGPDALSTTWPPAGIAVNAIAAGDLDNDGRDALVVAAEGGVYLIDDGDLPQDAAVTEFTARAPLPGATAPMALRLANVDGGLGLDVVVVYVQDAVVKISAFDGVALEHLGTHTLGDVVAPPTTAAAWLDPVTFPGGMPRLAIGMGNEIRHVLTTELDEASPSINPIPPQGGAWNQPLLASGYDDVDEQIVVSQPDAVYRSRIPTAPPPGDMFTWTETRNGTAWLGQIAVDLTADAIPEVLGYDPAGGTPSRICADKVSVVEAEVCMNVTLAHNVGVAMVSDTLTPVAGPDLMVIHAGATSADLTLYPELDLDDVGDVLTSAPSFSTTVTVAVARPAAASLGQSNHVLLLVGSDGTIACRMETPGALVPCT